MAETVDWTSLMNQAGPEVSSSFDPLPAGDYDLEVVASEAKTSGAGNKYWKIQTKVIGGTYNNRRVFDNITLVTSSQGALNFFFAKMAVLGLPRTYFNTQPNDDQIANAMVGRRFKAKVKQEAYNGEMQNKIDRYLKPLESGAPVGATSPAPPAPVAGVPAPPAPSPAPTPTPAAAPVPPVAAAQPSPAPVPAAGTVPPPPPLEGLPF